MNASRKTAVFLTVLYGAMLVAMLFFVAPVLHGFRSFALDSGAFDRGFGLGLFAGAGIGFVVMLCKLLVDSVVIACGPSFFRIHRLLFKYYDLHLEPPRGMKAMTVNPY